MALQHTEINVAYAPLSFAHPRCKITFLLAYHVHCLRLSPVPREPVYPVSVRLKMKQQACCGIRMETPLHLRHGKKSELRKKIC
jgi:hypothetical protein